MLHDVEKKVGVPMERLQKFLAQAGVASRREAERMIAAGRVRVNGQVVQVMGVTVDPARDRVDVDGRLVNVINDLHYYMLNKPTGVVTTVRDRHAERTVMDLVSDIPVRVYPVGRLDRDTTGLLLLTNDGALAMAMTHPRHHVEKTYRLAVKGNPSPEAIRSLREGILLEDGMTLPAMVKILESQKGQTILEMTIREGRKRQVRRMAGAIGHPVMELSRIRMGPLVLGDLPLGSYRPLTEDEQQAIRGLAQQVREEV